MLATVEFLPRLENKPGGNLTSDGQAVVGYLHKGDIDEHKAAACLYEYARHSEVLRKLAAFYRTGDTSDFRREHESYPWQIIEDTLGVATSEPLAFSWLWESVGDYFPERPWRDVPLDRRPRLSVGVRRLPTLNTRDFADYGEKARVENGRIFRAYQAAVQAGVDPLDKGPQPAVFKEGENGERLVVAFTLDLTIGRAALLRQFKAFLDALAESNTVLKKAGRAASERSAKPSDWLRDLALWRLHNYLRTEQGAVRDWIVEHGINPKTGEPLPMRDGRSQKGGTHAAEGRMDFSLKAAANRMKRNLHRLIPFEALSAKLAEEKKGFADDLWKEHLGGEQTNSQDKSDKQS